MTDPIPFLNAIAQALSALALYPEGHISRERALEAAYERLLALLEKEPLIRFSFLGDEVIFGDRPIRELRDWEWSAKMSGIGIQRVQFNDLVTRDELEEFLEMVLARVSLKTIDTSEARQTRPAGIKYGLVGVRGLDETGDLEDVVTATISYNVKEEADSVRWMHQELMAGNGLPLVEAEAVVRTLAVAMHGDQQIMLPLLHLREFDQYTTTHSLNVCVLSMGLAEWIGLGANDVRAFGVAGLMHEILNKPGKLTEEERAVMNRHPVDGARIIISSEPDLDMSAVIAYEHHIMLNGGGYPSFHYDRECHHGSKLVHVCDVYDALRTDRPYRDAWSKDEVLAYLQSRAGIEFDPEMVRAFNQMMGEWEPAPAYEDEEPDETASADTAAGPEAADS
jgi:HD-GYP domain-containing protein (c-di-GMP phosphodiesterase class II)